MIALSGLTERELAELELPIRAELGDLAELAGLVVVTTFGLPISDQARNILHRAVVLADRAVDQSFAAELGRIQLALADLEDEGLDPIVKSKLSDLRKRIMAIAGRKGV